MTVSTHVYTAHLIGSPDIELSVRGGSLTLDAGQAPHVQGNLTIAMPITSTLVALDPRTTKRIRVVATATFLPSGSQSRTFNLGLRDRTVSLTSGTVELSVASDEALLTDYAPLADDLTAFSLQSSLRSIVNYVLGVALPGASLAASTANDASAKVYSDAQNMITDPSNEGDGSIFLGENVGLDKDDWTWSAHGAESVNLHTPTNVDGFMSIGGGAGGMRLGMRPGGTYMFSATGRVKVALGGAAHPTRARRLVAFANVGGAYGFEPSSAALPTTVGTATRVSVVFTVPFNATEVFIRAYHGHNSGEIQWDAFRLSEYSGDPTDTGYFDGSKTDTAEYLYDWTGAANASTSERRALINRSPDSLTWKAGQSALDFLHPLVQVSGYRLVCDETREWTLRAEDYTAAGNLSLRTGVNMIDGEDSISRDAGLWFDAAVTEYTWIDSTTGQTVTRTDEYALTTPYAKLMTFERSTAYPGPGFSEYAVRRAQGRGREVRAQAVSDWTAAAEQPVVIMLSGAPTQIGVTQAVRFNLDNDELTVTTRTTDTPAGAIDLLTGTIDALVGTIDELT